MDNSQLEGVPAIQQQDPHAEVSVDLNEARKAAFDSMDFLGALALPSVVTIAFCAIFKIIWGLLTQALLAERGSRRFAIGLPRGHGKSMVVKLLCLWAILFSKRKFILIVGSTDDLAANILADVWDLLHESNITSVFGSADFDVEKNTSDLKKFSFNGRNVILASIGFNGNIRGVNLKFVRPDIMIFDDAQSRECAMSPAESKKFQEKLYGTFLKLKAPTGCIFIYIGNMYKNVAHPKSTADHPLYCCLLRNFKDDKFWTSFITGALLADGRALWEELIPREQLLEELEVDKAAGQEEEWFAEVQNDPECGSRNRIDFDSIVPIDYEQNPLEIDGACIIIDPATDKPNADDQVATHVDFINGKPCVYNVTVDNSSPKSFIQNTIAYCLRYQIPLICVEAVAYQHTLVFWFEETVKALHISGIQIMPLQPNKKKNERIGEMFKASYQGEISYHSNCFPQVLAQAKAFDPAVKNNLDDILDTIAYITQVQLLYKHLVYRPITLAAETDSDTTGNLTVEETSCI